MAQDYGKGKLYQGTFAGGEGPVMGQHTVNEAENKGYFGGEGKENTKFVGGAGEYPMPQGKDDMFSLHDKPYEGPENWVPANKGVVNPFDVE